MTILVGYLPDKGGRGALDLALQLARSTGDTLRIATVVPRQWSTPSLAKVDAEYVAYAEQVGAEAERRGREYLAEVAPEIEASFESVTGRSVSAALIAAAEDAGAAALVLGSSADGHLGQVVVGSTADRLLHSSPVPLAVSTRGYHPPRGQRITRITCAFSDAASSTGVVQRARELAETAGVEVRIVTFGIRTATMYPPEVGLHAEDAVLDSWAEQAAQAQRQLITDGVVPDGTAAFVATGKGWREAVESVEWEQGELLVLGSSSIGPLARVFLGSRATKLVRHSPVPVLVVASDPE